MQSPRRDLAEACFKTTKIACFHRFDDLIMISLQRFCGFTWAFYKYMFIHTPLYNLTQSSYQFYCKEKSDTSAGERRRTMAIGGKRRRMSGIVVRSGVVAPGLCQLEEHLPQINPQQVCHTTFFLLAGFLERQIVIILFFSIQVSFFDDLLFFPVKTRFFDKTWIWVTTRILTKF